VTRAFSLGERPLGANSQTLTQPLHFYAGTAVFDMFYLPQQFFSYPAAISNDKTANLDLI
jgi:hypothetical protein